MTGSIHNFLRDRQADIVDELIGWVRLRSVAGATGRPAPAVNLKVLVEGEEEAGSTHLAGLIEENRERLDVDLVVFSDTLTWRADHPAVCTSVRGMVMAEIEVYGPCRDVHSGAASGPAPKG
jgi:acetylornithine deacetylase/succinyl-diaminopimelate desuccinylase-like protein